jgi:signal transduction histidine kinase
MSDGNNRYLDDDIIAEMRRRLGDDSFTPDGYGEHGEPVGEPIGSASTPANDANGGNGANDANGVDSATTARDAGDAHDASMGDGGGNGGGTRTRSVPAEGTGPWAVSQDGEADEAAGADNDANPACDDADGDDDDDDGGVRAAGDGGDETAARGGSDEAGVGHATGSGCVAGENSANADDGDDDAFDGDGFLESLDDHGYNTGRRGAGRGMPFSRKLSLGMAGISALTAVILILVLSITWTDQMRRNSQISLSRIGMFAANSIADSYESNDGWDSRSIERLAEALTHTNDLGMQVSKPDGEVIYSTATASIDAIRRGEGTLPASYSDGIGSSLMQISDHNGMMIGFVRVWSLSGNPSITSDDSLFMSNTYLLISLVALSIVLFSTVAGSVMASEISKPITKITETAAKIRSGETGARTQIRGNDEIGKLGETFDGMADILERNSEMERSLTRNVAHELRTPLMAMQVNIECMEDGVMEPNLQNLSLVGSEIHRMSRMIDAILELAKLENGTAPCNPVPTDLAQMASDIVEEEKLLFEDAGLCLSFVHDGTKCVADADPDMIHRSILNLVTNALRYTDAGGSVTVSAGTDRSDVIISVADTGIGIAKEDRQKVFDRFWRADESRQQSSGGLGIGLAMTREMVLTNGGDITVESEPGIGSTFTIRLPKRSLL